MQDFIKKFASDAAIVIDTCVDVINRQNAELTKLRGMQRKASAAPAPESANTIKLDSAQLQKAASALHTMHGNPTTCTPEQIAQYWESNPNSMLNLIEKMASAAAAKASDNASFGRLVEKKASAATVTVKSKDAASDAFWSNN